MLGLYHAARTRGLRPALLESLGPRTPFSRLSLLGVRPRHRLEVWEGRLYLDGRRVGEALDLFSYLERGLGRGFFPAWMGFFAYEFARHLGLATHPPLPGLPEAAFFYYPEGFALLEGHLVQGPSLPLAPLAYRPGPLPRHPLVSDFPQEAFVRGVEEVRERIRAGVVYQVNLSHRFRLLGPVDPLLLYARLRSLNPSPFMGLLEGEGWAVVSGSPERLFQKVGPRVRARPIAGTRPRGGSEAEDLALEEELLASPKERAEHAMLVDLLRNDLARVALPGTVRVRELFTVERYAHVMHLVSEVEGYTRASLGEVFRSLFPGGTITGAPKGTVMEAIRDLEPVPRGAYTGSLGYVSGQGADFNILIRSFQRVGEEVLFSAGAGVVIASEAQAEYRETLHKAESLLLALERGRPGQKPLPPRPTASWTPPPPPRRRRARVLFLENRDSFSYNLVDYLKALGAEVEVADQEEAPRFAGFTHLLVGPGPKDPYGAGRVLEWTEEALREGIPFLGVCLGHQALGVALGAELYREAPVHGEAHPVFHGGEALFQGFPNPLPFARYHSLALRGLPPSLRLLAWTGEGVPMALWDGKVAFGVQFHPESILSPWGMELLARFLEVG
ncbi:Anthranilate synthase component II/para-aminobenzoate synthase glutamine amidotransferase component II [Thermus sp. CCB_US3_UF1]|uniref:chorismate-binding protein n=1 Tax=Thermus sp. CCB_US3_UF1 TaxID=1111069 RepID=UPI0002389F5B|nr:chorismate-binding protein [Thermus sp. CCB_US3_UF1]AEV16127.1 Anthranilate synthase component II/para-aminobenzoate synthase glutamine amidotransferase component II [Thermus sp. CCB_US3_UF1]